MAILLILFFIILAALIVAVIAFSLTIKKTRQRAESMSEEEISEYEKMLDSETND